MTMNSFISKKLIEKYRKNIEPIVGQNDYKIMESEVIKKLRNSIPELYEKFFEEEFGKWVQVYMD
jgi:ABC-type sulfate transport system substrate-binding protein